MHFPPLTLHKPDQPLDFAAEGGSDEAELPGVKWISSGSTYGILRASFNGVRARTNL